MSKPGHNSKTQAATVAGQKIKSYVDRVEKLEEERKAIGGDIRDVYAEAKGNGYDVKTLRWLVQERRIQAVDRDERDALRDTYKHALDMAVHLVQVEGLSLREAGRITGASKSSIHRALAVPSVSQPQDGDDGITESCGERAGTRSPNQSGVETARYDGDARNQANPAVVGPPARFDSGPHDADHVPDARNMVEAPATPSVGAVASPEGERVATPFLGDDPGDPPPFLRRGRGA